MTCTAGADIMKKFTARKKFVTNVATSVVTLRASKNTIKDTTAMKKRNVTYVKNHSSTHEIAKDTIGKFT